MPWFTKLDKPDAFEGTVFALLQRRLKKGDELVSGPFAGYTVEATKFLRTSGKDYSIPVPTGAVRVKEGRRHRTR